MDWNGEGGRRIEEAFWWKDGDEREGEVTEEYSR